MLRRGGIRDEGKSKSRGRRPGGSRICVRVFVTICRRDSCILVEKLDQETSGHFGHVPDSRKERHNDHSKEPEDPYAEVRESEGEFHAGIRHEPGEPRDVGEHVTEVKSQGEISDDEQDVPVGADNFVDHGFDAVATPPDRGRDSSEGLFANMVGGVVDPMACSPDTEADDHSAADNGGAGAEQVMHVVDTEILHEEV